MELQAPIKESDQSYIIPINIESNLRFSYSSRESGRHTTPPDTHETLKEFLNELASAYEAYSKNWFHSQLFALQFLKRLTHTWTFGTHSPYMGSSHAIMVHQIWCPEKLQIYPRMIQLHWNLVEVVYGNEHPPGFTNVVVDPDTIPFTGMETIRVNPSAMERALRKVREARLQAAVTAAHAKNLLVRYYERYGTAELMQPDSVLSSSEEEGEIGEGSSNPETKNPF
jgi:hypothetical protein